MDGNKRVAVTVTCSISESERVSAWVRWPRSNLFPRWSLRNRQVAVHGSWDLAAPKRGAAQPNL